MPRPLRHVREPDGTVTCYYKTRFRGAALNICLKCRRPKYPAWGREDWDRMEGRKQRKREKAREAAGLVGRTRRRMWLEIRKRVRLGERVTVGKELWGR